MSIHRRHLSGAPCSFGGPRTLSPMEERATPTVNIMLMGGGPTCGARLSIYYYLYLFITVQYNLFCETVAERNTQRLLISSSVVMKTDIQKLANNSFHQYSVMRLPFFQIKIQHMRREMRKHVSSNQLFQNGLCDFQI